MNTKIKRYFFRYFDKNTRFFNKKTHRHIYLFLTSTNTMHYSPFIFPDCKSGPLALFPICNFSLPARQRAVDLISRMTIDQKASWLINTVQPIPELGLPPYQWWNEALHGVMFRKPHNGIPEATQFPSPHNLAASFNLDIIHHVARTISTEARATNNENITGLDFFTPNINIVRDPRWGRGQETPGEDPFLTSQYIYTMVRGLQEGEDSRYLKISTILVNILMLMIWNSGMVLPVRILMHECW